MSPPKMAADNRHGHRAGQPRRRPRFHPRLPPKSFHPRNPPKEAPSNILHPRNPPDDAPESFLHPSFLLGKTPLSRSKATRRCSKVTRSAIRHLHQQKQPETWHFRNRHRVSLLSIPNSGVSSSSLHLTHYIGTQEESLLAPRIVYRSDATFHFTHVQIYIRQIFLSTGTHF
jgi:hypothetical protein